MESRSAAPVQFRDTPRFMCPTHPTLRSRIESFLAPSYSVCMKCGRPWNHVEPHSTPYRDGSGCFPLCEACWAGLIPVERMPYYDALVDEWIRQTPSETAEYEKSRRLIFLAVMRGE